MNIDGENLREPCPTPEWLGAYVDGKLTSEEKALTESHLAKCSRCRRVIKLIAESESDAPAPAPPDPHK
jgi:anti-sigma factor RsiW